MKMLVLSDGKVLFTRLIAIHLAFDVVGCFVSTRVFIIYLVDSIVNPFEEMSPYDYC